MGSNLNTQPTKDLYAILDISKSASDDEIKKAYKKSALKYHPDRNPDTKEESTIKFQEVGNAFKILSDPDKRARYDKFGIIDGDEGMNTGMNPFDIFQNMFGGMGSQNMQSSNTKSPDKKLTINISLIDIYKGKNVNIDFTKHICCDKCEGSGAISKDNIKQCKSCNGQGRIVRMLQMGPMIQQTVQSCGQCYGKGKSIELGKECIKCKGVKSNSIKRHIDCYVRAGAQSGSTITFKNEADWTPDCSDTGDLIVFINSKNEEGLFRREGENLIMKKTITLLEALTKTEFLFKHLDDRILKVSYEEIIKQNQKMIIKGEGMHGQVQNGDLIIIFDIIFPNNLDKERSKYLIKILPLPIKQIWDLQLENTNEEDITEVNMNIFDDNININDNIDVSIDEYDINSKFNSNQRPVECSTQ